MYKKKGSAASLSLQSSIKIKRIWLLVIATEIHLYEEECLIHSHLPVSKNELFRSHTRIASNSANNFCLHLKFLADIWEH